MKKIFFSALISLVSFELYADLGIYGTCYQNLIIQKLYQNWNYYDQSILYLKLRKPSQDNYSLNADLSFSLSNFSNNIYSLQSGVEILNFETNPIKSLKLTLGRFLPGWHYTYFFQPMNFFLPFTLFLNDLIYTGIDGLSLKEYFSDLSSLEYVTVSKNKIRDFSHYFNFTSNIAGFDYSAIGGYSGQNSEKVIAAGFKGDIGVSFFNETVLTFENYRYPIYQAAGGFDYSLKNIMFIFEYYYQYSHFAEDLSIRSGLRDHHYLYSNIFYFEPNGFNLGIFTLTNFDDKSSLLAFYYQVDIFNSSTLLLGIYAPVSKNSIQEFSYNVTGSPIFNSYCKLKF